MLNATTAGGGIEARVTGTAFLNTLNGDIKVVANSPTELSVSTCDGKVSISGRFDRGTVTASTSGGSVFYQ